MNLSGTAPDANRKRLVCYADPLQQLGLQPSDGRSGRPRIIVHSDSPLAFHHGAGNRFIRAAGPAGESMQRPLLTFASLFETNERNPEKCQSNAKRD